jgi:hypothetical protein
MKKSILLGLVIVFLSACQNQKTRYTQASPEIDKTKKLIQAYDAKNYESLASYYADTAKLFINSVDKSLTPKQLIKLHQTEDINFPERGFLKENQVYEMVLTDKGKIWVNFWGNWKGILKENNKVIKIPVHVTFQFINGKIVEEYGYWDNGPIILAMQEVEASREIDDSK